MPIFLPLTVNAQLPSVSNSVCGGSALTINTAQQSCPNSDTSNQSINNVIREVINIFSVIVGFMSVVALAFGGYYAFLASNGQSGKAIGDKAKNTIIYALVGLIVVVVAQVIVRIVISKGTATIV